MGAKGGSGSTNAGAKGGSRGRGVRQRRAEGGGRGRGALMTEVWTAVPQTQVLNDGERKQRTQEGMKNTP
jgi:hypothetical protein